MSDITTVIQAAERTGVSRQTISTWVKVGKLAGKAVRVGNLTATLVSVAQVRKLKASQPRGRPAKT